MQRAWTILLSVACPAVNIFPHCLINATTFERSVECNMCVCLLSSTNFVHTFLILRRNERDTEAVYRSSSKVPLLL